MNATAAVGTRLRTELHLGRSGLPHRGNGPEKRSLRDNVVDPIRWSYGLVEVSTFPQGAVGSFRPVREYQIWTITRENG